METDSHNREHWDNQRFVIGRVGKLSLSEPLSDTPVNTGTVTELRLFNPQDGYERLALQRAAAFQGMDPDKVLSVMAEGSRALTLEEQTERQEIWEKLRDSSSVVYGFMVTGRILSYAVEAYATHCLETGEELSVTTLENILRSPKSFDNTAKLLALMPLVPNNRGWELAAHLRDGLYNPWPGYTPLTIEQNGEDRFLTFSAETRISAMGRILEQGESAETIGECPAANVYLPRLWQQMISDCVNDPNLFQADLINSIGVESR